MFQSFCKFCLSLALATETKTLVMLRWYTTVAVTAVVAALLWQLSQATRIYLFSYPLVVVCPNSGVLNVLYFRVCIHSHSPLNCATRSAQMDVTRAGSALYVTPDNTFRRTRQFPRADFRAVVKPNVDTLYSSAFIVRNIRHSCHPAVT